jgi:hypothetical protein
MCVIGGFSLCILRKGSSKCALPLIEINYGPRWCILTWSDFITTTSFLFHALLNLPHQVYPILIHKLQTTKYAKTTHLSCISFNPGYPLPWDDNPNNLPKTRRARFDLRRLIFLEIDLCMLFFSVGAFLMSASVGDYGHLLVRVFPRGKKAFDSCVSYIYYLLISFIIHAPLLHTFVVLSSLIEIFVVDTSRTRLSSHDNGLRLEIFTGDRAV